MRHRLRIQGISSFVVPGTAAHMDRQVDVDAGNHEEIVSSLEKDFLDWYLLTQACSIVCVADRMCSHQGSSSDGDLARVRVGPKQPELC